MNGRFCFENLHVHFNHGTLWAKWSLYILIKQQLYMKGEIAAKEPAAVELEEGKKYLWCACGK